MTRLRSVNPFVAEPDRGSEPLAQAALRRILEAPVEAPAPSPRPIPRRKAAPRRLVLALTTLVIGVGGAVAAADPMGWWSSSPDQARYHVSPGLRVRTPTAQQLRCRAHGHGQFFCTPERERCYQIGQQAPFCKLSGTGLPYTRVDTIQAPPKNSILSRAGFQKGIAKSLAAGTLTSAGAAQFRADLARVPDSFFVEIRLAFQYGTISVGSGTRRGQTLVPPIGQPSILVCAEATGRIQCQNMNGDASTPVGAGVYAAVQGPGWRWLKATSSVGGLPPGIHFTPAEYRVLIDLLRFGATTSGSSGTHATTTQATPITHLHGSKAA